MRRRCPQQRTVCPQALAAGRLALELVAVCDVTPAAAQRAMAVSGARPYTDHRELLEKERPDAAAIIIPEGPRDAVLLDVLDAGVHTCKEAYTTLQPQIQALLDQAKDRRQFTTYLPVGWATPPQ